MRIVQRSAKRGGIDTFKKNADGKLFVTIIFITAFLIQAAGLIRYIYRLPGDYLGIGFYAATIVGFAIATIQSLVQLKKKNI